ncbi:hypothetical protein [Streptomyces sp. HNM0574]|uniref:hypothetical protein n=1 Tax=Streptomyces sp. HNM0574 TaxID=2714954 RepID=UPI00146ADDBC|nr:hypothetical protein [Streptomyces sp. HNM0574]NLU69680.1 hypothetical protein [Streptomyces sp. HNM0574]
MSGSSFIWNLPDASGRPPQATEEPEEAPVTRQALRVLPGATFLLAGMYLAAAIATVLNGDFRVAWMLSALPAVGAAFLTVRGVRLRRVVLCAVSLGALVVWGVLAAVLG